MDVYNVFIQGDLAYAIAFQF